MSSDKKLCHGQFDGLMGCSQAEHLNLIRKFLWQVRINGLRRALELTVSKFMRVFGMKRKSRSSVIRQKEQSTHDEVLNLEPGELVEVKSEEEILVTLNQKGENKGLFWMPEMRKFCGRRFRVFKRLERILLESTGEYRKVKNTVLLEGVMCDGQGFYGCDRSCFHFWREVWLRRVEE